MAKVQYIDGNVNNAVVVHGEDPTNSDNVLVSSLPASTSVAKSSVTDVNDTPDVHLESAAGTEQIDDRSETQKLRDEIRSLKEAISGDKEGE